MKLHVYEKRTEAGLSLQELSEKSGVAKSYLQRLEEDSANPSIEILCKLSKALGVPVESLFSCE